MNRAAAIFLVLLRLCIGWHFLFEGIQKVHSHYTGETVTSRPFSSAGYFREAPGPAGSVWRWANGHPDAEALARLVPAPLEGERAADRPFSRMPPGLLADWKSLATRYADHYKIGREKADVLIEQLGNEAVRWLEWQPDPILEEVRSRFGRLESVDLTLLGEREKSAYQAFSDNTAEQKRTFPSGELTRRMSMAERIAEYRQKLDDFADASGRKLWKFGKDVEKTRLTAAKAELGRLRTGLLDDLNRTQTAAFIRALNNLVAAPVADAVGRLAKEKALPLAAALDKDLTVLTPAQAASVKVEPIDVKALREQLGRLTQEAAKAGVKADDLESGLATLPDVEALKPQRPSPVQRWMDVATAWGLTVVGACILVGFLTRISCWLAALFLLTTYLAVPAFPWLPVVGPSEGNYLFVNKNVVEMFALCALGCLPTGRWFGADGLLRSMWLWMTGGVDDEKEQR